jgi:hypothetical protein
VNWQPAGTWKNGIGESREFVESYLAIPPKWLHFQGVCGIIVAFVTWFTYCMTAKEEFLPFAGVIPRKLKKKNE